MKKPRLRYSHKQPTEPGWYWATNVGDIPGVPWEAVVCITRAEDGTLYCSWMQAPGKAQDMPKGEWSPGTRWAGPIAPPKYG